jgi:hypothetical protein
MMIEGKEGKGESGKAGGLHGEGGWEVRGRVRARAARGSSLGGLGAVCAHDGAQLRQTKLERVKTCKWRAQRVTRGPTLVGVPEGGAAWGSRHRPYLARQWLGAHGWHVHSCGVLLGGKVRFE